MIPGLLADFANSLQFSSSRGDAGRSPVVVTPTNQAMALVKLITQKWEYARCTANGKLLSEQRQNDLLEGIKRSLGMVKTLNVEQGIELHRLIDLTLVGERYAGFIRDAVDQKVNLSGTGSHMDSTVDRRQKLANPEVYQTTLNWNVYQTGEADICLAEMAQRLRRIGCMSLDEKSFAGATAIALHRAGPIHGDYALEKQRRLKEYFHNLEGVVTPPGPNPPKAFPLTTAQFRDEHPEWYGVAYPPGTEPVECPIRPDLVRILKSSVPCRSTRSGCTAGSQPERRPSQLQLQDPRMRPAPVHLQFPQLALPGPVGWTPPPPHIANAGNTFSSPSNVFAFESPPANQSPPVVGLPFPDFRSRQSSLASLEPYNPPDFQSRQSSVHASLEPHVLPQPSPTVEAAPPQELESPQNLDLASHAPSVASVSGVPNAMSAHGSVATSGSTDRLISGWASKYQDLRSPRVGEDIHEVSEGGGDGGSDAVRSGVAIPPAGVAIPPTRPPTAANTVPAGPGPKAGVIKKGKAKGKGGKGKGKGSKAKHVKGGAAGSTRAGGPKMLALCDKSSSKPAKISRSAIEYDPAWEKRGGPKHYAHVTVYIDRVAQQWRVKPCPGKGGRKETKLPFKSLASHAAKKEKWGRVQNAVLDALANPPA